MSQKLSRRPGGEAVKQRRRAQKRAARRLRQQQRAQGLEASPPPALPNRKSGWGSVAEEQAGRQQTVEEQVKVMRSLLPSLLKRFAKIRAIPRH